MVTELEKIDNSKNRLWIVPNNDLEAKTIINILTEQGEQYLITNQKWGASWENLEPGIKEKVEETKKSNDKKIYGIELQGYCEGTENIDHHVYGSDDRSNSKSSLEQVAEILRRKLSIDEKFVAANDKGYIPAMEILGRSLNLSESEIKKYIEKTRKRDREIQGITDEQERQAEEVIDKIEIKSRNICIHLPHSRTATVQDRLWGKFDNLLIISDGGEVNFYGTTRMILELKERFPNSYYGGTLSPVGYGGYWGTDNVDEKEILAFFEDMVNDMEAER